MPHKLIWEPKGVYWKYYGKISGKEVIDASTAIYGDPRFDNLKYKLVDFTDVEIFDMNDNEMLQIACQHTAASMSNPNIKNALISNEKTKELSEKFCSFFKNFSWEVQVFQDMNKANEWLGRTTDS